MIQGCCVPLSSDYNKNDQDKKKKNPKKQCLWEYKKRTKVFNQIHWLYCSFKMQNELTFPMKQD